MSDKRGRGRPPGRAAYDRGNSPFFHPPAKTVLRSRLDGHTYSVVRTIGDQVDYICSDCPDLIKTAKDIYWRKLCLLHKMQIVRLAEESER